MGRQGRSIAGIVLLLLALMGVALWLVLSSTPDSPGETDPVSSEVDEADASAGRAPSGAPSGAPVRDSQRTSQARGSGKLSGEVRMSEDRRPVSGQRVVLSAPDGTVRETVTDEGGRFEFEGVARDARHKLTVEAPGFGTVRRAGVRLGRHRRLDLGTLWIAPSAFVVVEVFGSDGKPLDGALVKAYTVGLGATGFFAEEPPAAVDRATTNGKGEARFPRLAAGRWNFVAHSPGYERRATGDLALQAGASELRFRVTLSRGERLSGRVLDPRGKPVPGVRVVALRRTLTADQRTAPLAIHGRTDGNGRFELLGLPAADVVLWTARSGEDLRVAAAVRLPGVSEIDIVIPDGTALVGKVTDEDDAPLAGARVKVPFQLPLGIWFIVEAETDDEGAFEARFPSSGTLGVATVDLDGYSPHPAFSGHKGPIPAGRTVSQHLRLARGATLTGRVTGPDGPLGGVAVYAERGARPARTDRDGRYVFSNLTPGTYEVSPYKWAYVPVGAARQIEVPVGGRVTADFEMQRGQPVRGRVTDESGAALAGVEVWVDGVDVGWAATTGPDGRYELGAVTPGQLTIHGEKGGYTMGRVIVKASAGAAIEGADIVMRPLYRVTGRVYASGGKLPAGAYVQIAGHGGGGAPHPTRMEWMWLNFERLPVNPDGSYDHTVALADSGFVVHAAAPGYASATSERVELDGSAVYEVGLRLERGAAASGTVEDATGKRLAGAWVTAKALQAGQSASDVTYPGAWGPPIAATTDSQGAFRIENLNPGRYAIEARTHHARAPAVIVEVPDAAPVSLRLEP